MLRRKLHGGSCALSLTDRTVIQCVQLVHVVHKSETVVGMASDQRIEPEVQFS